MWCQPSWFPFVYLIYKREGIYNFFTISVNLSKFCSHLWHSWDLASWQFSYNKSTRCTNFSHLFWRETLHVSDSSSVHHQEFFTVHATMVYVIQVYWQPVSGIPLTGCRQTCMTYTIAVCTVKNSWWWTEKLPETCRVSFQNKFEK